MPRPDSKIMQTNVSDATDVAPKPASRLRATPSGRKLANVVPLNPATGSTETPAPLTGAKKSAATRMKKAAVLAALSPAEVKKRKKDLVESLKLAGTPLKEAQNLLAAATKDVEKAIADHAKAQAKAQKDHEKQVKALTKTRDSYDALAKKRAEAFEKGKAKVEAEIAKLG